MADGGHDGAAPAPIRVAVVGMSVSQICGARDHAVLLADGLAAENVECELHWLYRSSESLRTARSQFRPWRRQLEGALRASPPDAVLLHYSVFSYCYRGLPLFVHPTLSAIDRPRVPLIGVMHELAYQRREPGWRGRVWGATHRLALVELMRRSSAAVVTADFRAEWLRSRRWLPRRPLVLAPVFSNLPPPAPRAAPEGSRPLIGLFGYAYEGAAVALVLDAIRLLRGRGVEVALRLFGAPGRSSAVGERWVAQAAERGIGEALSFSGTLPAQALSDALAGCEVLLFAGANGPTSRKGTLAGSLASGRPVVAIDGPRSWSELIEAQAARVVPPSAGALADAVGELLGDEAAREALGARGRSFAEQQMGVARSARVVAELLRDCLYGAASARPGRPVARTPA